MFTHTCNREQNQTQPWGALAIRSSAGRGAPRGWQAFLLVPSTPFLPSPGSGRSPRPPFLSPALPFHTAEGLFLILSFAAKGEMFWFLIEMFTQRAHWVLSPRGRQVRASPHGCGCTGDGKQHSLHPHARPGPRTRAHGFRALSLLWGRRTHPGQEAGELLLPVAASACSQGVTQKEPDWPLGDPEAETLTERHCGPETERKEA